MCIKNVELKMESFFNCTQCGDCCYGHGGTYVDAKKIKEIADFLNISEDELKDKFLVLSSEKKYMIACGENGKCIFFKENCSIHPVKPRMCREWPFLPAVLKEDKNWRQMSDACEGIKTDVDIKDLKKFILISLKDTRTDDEIVKFKTLISNDSGI